MLKEFLVDFTKQYHELGHSGFIGIDALQNSDAVNRMIDSASGFGHRLKTGHSFDGLLHSIEIDGIHGATSWFDHMLKDFTSHDGIPLPGAMFIQDITGMDYQESVDWLCINAADVLELGATAAALKLLDTKFKNNPQLKIVTLAVAGCVGIIDDNPLLVGYAAIKASKQINDKFKIVSDEKIENLKVASRGFYRGVKVVSVGTFFTGVAAQAFFDTNIVEVVSDVVIHSLDGIASFAENAGIINDAADHLDTITDVASGAGDLIDGAATFGLGIVASYGVKKLFAFFNDEKKDNVQKLSEKIIIRRQIRDAIKKKLPPSYIKEYISRGIQKECYNPIIRFNVC